ncbi:hypothetical protein GE061_000679 [Apolygus lucorum]|uniref:Uncharacterized protein n=1 Tax=Apolygus lucorum TaxID=248454 RepID=A0A6A4KJN3_APOLU|nr:hypothetical protein GE061_000679 [Apolygus lucorum]
MREDAQVGQLTLGELMAAIKEILPTKEEFASLSSEIQVLKQENTQLKEQVNKLRSDCAQNTDTIEFLLNKSKEKNLIFRGIPLGTDADPSTIVTKLLNEVLKINEHINITKAYFIGPASPTKMILVELAKPSDKWIIFKNVHKLRGLNITISQDYSARTREKRQKLFAVKSEIKRLKGEGVDTFVRNNLLLVNKQRFYWSEEKGLVNSKEEDATAALKSLTGEDMSRFVENIKTGTISQQRPRPERRGTSSARGKL